MHIDWKKRLYNYVPDIAPEVPSLGAIAIRVLVSITTGMWLTFLPTYFFIIYMLHEKFFSYDFFSDGVFGLKTFLVVLLVLLLVTAFYLWGFLLLGKKACIAYTKPDRKDYNMYRWLTYLMLALSVFMHAIFYAFGSETNHEIRVLSFSLIGFILVWAITSFLGANLIKKVINWVPSVAFIVLSATIPALNADITADLVRIGLINFNVGGGVHAKVFSTDNPDKIIYEGKLLLLTPNNAYFREGKKSYKIIKQSENITVSIGKG
ncbi:hypothetical protein [Ottowia oryzae]|uniref:Uncharacterized protein n=1 Tax=Ottowia oryzae TaxID=2109914 RepID=A0A2S0MF78_9BURK|nr:hypothetical protein [Ottowia oryzae]AVO34534.1 hypothetical protein C6570_10080 [Ottowia oryzae]